MRIRQTRVMKFIVILLACVLIGLAASSLFGCNKDNGPKTVNVSVTHELYDYDKETETSGAKKEDNNIKCGSRYKLVFNLDFTNLDSSVISVTMKIVLGSYENDENKAHIAAQSKEDGGGLHFEPIGNGEYATHFNLSSNTQIDYSKTYFIVGIDSLGKDDSSLSYQPVEVTFSSNEAEFSFNGGNLGYYLSLVPIKGSFDFSEKNLSQAIGINAVKHNMSINIPDKCGKIEVAFYDIENKTAEYGRKSYSESEYPDEFVNKKLSIVLSDLMIDYIGQDRYDEWTSAADGFTVCIEITAVGGNNYNDSVVAKNYTFN